MKVILHEYLECIFRWNEDSLFHAPFSPLREYNMPNTLRPSFANSNSDAQDIFVSSMLFEISCYIGPRYTESISCKHVLCVFKTRWLTCFRWYAPPLLIRVFCIGQCKTPAFLISYMLRIETYIYFNRTVASKTTYKFIVENRMSSPGPWPKCCEK